jgi:hypothetical protein
MIITSFIPSAIFAFVMPHPWWMWCALVFLLVVANGIVIGYHCKRRREYPRKHEEIWRQAEKRIIKGGGRQLAPKISLPTEVPARALPPNFYRGHLPELKREMTVNCPCGWNASGPVEDVKAASFFHTCEKTDRYWNRR